MKRFYLAALSMLTAGGLLGWLAALSGPTRTFAQGQNADRPRNGKHSASAPAARFQVPGQGRENLQGIRPAAVSPAGEGAEGRTERRADPAR